MSWDYTIGYLTKDTYDEWIDKFQGYATEVDIWRFIDPNGVDELATTKPVLPKSTEMSSNLIDSYAGLVRVYPEDSDLVRDILAVRPAEPTSSSSSLSGDSMFITINEYKYWKDLEIYMRKQSFIADLRSQIWDAIHPNYRCLISGTMSCRDVLRKIRSYLKPSREQQRNQLTFAIEKAKIPPEYEEMDLWLMEWERIDIIANRLNMIEVMAKLEIEFAQASESLLPEHERKGWAESCNPGFFTERRRFNETVELFRVLWRECEIERLKKEAVLIRERSE